ncbi:NADPH dehydrogenase [Malassezia brasiliensis]|uniref:NADPH dehydrogenase n=1 Tax=Malassezia brasiliensis TaxID=1821822 RepID=A0AAF0DX58_9BASI|nr:NADPH dehydrogenase [Malassezia brasiliensis]
MADVWIGRKRWTCTYCQVTINDDVPSRQHHESGMRHKNNVERALRGLYKDTAAQRREAERHAREIAEIEYAAGRAHRKQDGAGAVPGQGAAAAPAAPKAWAPSDKMATYTTARALGVRDEDEQAWQAQFARRKAAARVGEWETVAEAPRAVPDAAEPAAPDAAPDVAPVTERQYARSFVLREQTLADQQEDLPEIVVKRRRTDGDRVKEEPGAGAAPRVEELGEGPVPKEEPREAPVPKEEPREAPVPPVKEEPGAGAVPKEEPGAGAVPPVQEAGEAPAAEDALFRKRKPRGGATKKVTSRAFT